MTTFPYRLMVLLCYPELSGGHITHLSQTMRKVKVSKLGEHLKVTTHKLTEALDYLHQAGLVTSITHSENHYVLVSIKKGPQ